MQTIASLAQNLYAFCNVAIKYTIYPFLICNAVTEFKTIWISSFKILKILKMKVKILKFSKLIPEPYGS
jgi:hypothetical protein